MLSRLPRTELTSVLLVFVAAGFALLLVELLLIQHTWGSQKVAVGAAAIGLVLSLIAYLPHVRLRRTVAALFVVLALAGVYGFGIHLSSYIQRQAQVAGVLMPSDRLMMRARINFSRNPPFISPLALSGLSALGVVTLSYQVKARGSDGCPSD